MFQRRTVILILTTCILFTESKICYWSQRLEAGQLKWTLAGDNENSCTSFRIGGVTLAGHGNGPKSDVDPHTSSSTQRGSPDVRPTAVPTETGPTNGNYVTSDSREETAVSYETPGTSGGVPTQDRFITDPMDPPIAFIRISTYEWIYNDKGTGANTRVSIHRPKATEDGYYPVGDVAVAGCWCAPSNSSIVVKERHPGSLAAPAHFTEIWNDAWSGGYQDVRIMRMDPPSGFTCLGYVAVIGYSSTPNANRYRCVNDTYASTTGRYENIWYDGGSGARQDLGIWGNRVYGNDINALDSGVFTAFPDHSEPSGAPPMLDGRFAKEPSLVSD